MSDLEIKDLTVEYASGGYVVRPIDGLNLNAGSGELVLLLGPSGCGKTTLLSCLAGILTPTSGAIRFGPTAISGLTGEALTEYRRRTVGIVFQAFNLIPSLTARENVATPLRLAGVRRREARLRADALLERVGLGDRAHHRPAELSGGQQQRVAIARALVSHPTVIFADEPTGNLDSATGAEILTVLREAVDTYQQTTLMVTHDAGAAAIADRALFLADGLIVRDAPCKDAGDIMAILADLSAR